MDALVKAQGRINDQHAQRQQAGVPQQGHDGHGVLALPDNDRQHRQNHQPQIEKNLLQRTPVQVMVEYLYHAFPSAVPQDHSPNLLCRGPWFQFLTMFATNFTCSTDAWKKYMGCF